MIHSCLIFGLKLPLIKIKTLLSPYKQGGGLFIKLSTTSYLFSMVFNLSSISLRSCFRCFMFVIASLVPSSKLV